MPTYQYECDSCGHSFEHYQSMLDKKLKKCPQCDELKLCRLIGAGTGVIFKGSGFYETDYKNKPAPSGASSQDKAKREEKTDTAKEASTTTNSDKKASVSPSEK